MLWDQYVNIFYQYIHMHFYKLAEYIKIQIKNKCYIIHIYLFCSLILILIFCRLVSFQKLFPMIIWQQCTWKLSSSILLDTVTGSGVMVRMSWVHIPVVPWTLPGTGYKAALFWLLILLLNYLGQNSLSVNVPLFTSSPWLNLY